MSIDIKAAAARFEARFGHAPTVGARAPGRVNIIGEHTDYNGGFVLPMAIERETVVLGSPRKDRVLNAYAANLERSAQLNLDHLDRNPSEHWMDYVTGVARELGLLGKPVVGADILILGDVPVGAGLSSSASLEMAALKFFEVLGGFTLEGPAGAKLGQRVENDFLDLKTGIMDQFIVRMGQHGHALFLDCRSYEYESIPIKFDDAVFVIANTGVSRGLASSKYNERVHECGEAVEAMRRVLGGSGKSLRDFPGEADLDACRGQLRDVVYRRARHVITENARTQDAAEAMRRGDAAALGRLMNASGDSLRIDYEVTCNELDIMTRIARSHSACFGSRMTGAGFGGCTVSLVAAGHADKFCEFLAQAYRSETGIRAELVVSSAAQGATQVGWRG
ncbi:MAG: galactokinase [Candidatus Hydrogenedentes bacterium]|nr:galactokinase [Candidatus Hydrogenedentota bacterium]